MLKNEPITTAGYYRPDLESYLGFGGPLGTGSLLGLGYRPQTISPQEASLLQAQGVQTPEQYVTRKARLPVLAEG